MKEKQKQILSEMMQEDEKSGLYDETIEQAALNNCVCKTKECVHFKSFLNGAKWKQERIYSKEEVLEIIDSLFHRYASSFRIDAKEYFLRFKKK